MIESDIVLINNHKFNKICDIIPYLDQTGRPREYLPCNRFTNKKNLKLHKYGQGPFCRFTIDSSYSGKSGVYVILIDKQLHYVGECVDLFRRFYSGYGNISPRNCFEGGQSTNCRINNKILQVYKTGSKIELYFIESNNRFQIERDLISKHAPAWNISSGNTSLSGRSELLSPKPPTKPMTESNNAAVRILPGNYITLTGQNFKVISIAGNKITIKTDNSNSSSFHLNHLLLCLQWLKDGRVIQGIGGDHSISSLIGKDGTLVKCKTCDRNPTYIFGIISSMPNINRTGRTLRFNKN